MIPIAGLVLLFACVFGGYVAAGGHMAPILKAAPLEMVIILGAGVAGMLVGNSMPIFKGAMAGMGRVFKGPKYKRDDYLAIIFVVTKLLKTLKSEGAVAVESHVENPESSAIFSETPQLLKDGPLLHLVTDTVRLMVVSQGTLSPYAVEEVMDASIKSHLHHEMEPADALATLAGALPALGIVACVLGVVKTMAAIDQPPAILGEMVGKALVGTFLGVFLAYGLVEPFASRLKQIIAEDMQIFHVVKQLLVGTLHGHPMPLIIEAARVAISHEHQPSFSDVFDGMRGK